MANTDRFTELVAECDVLITHESCADGLGGALLTKDALPGLKRIEWLQYNTEAHRKFVPVEGEKYLFVDITPHPLTVDRFVEAGAILLDHHHYAKELVVKFGERAKFGDEMAEPGVSGTVLAYRHVWKPLMEATASDEEKAFVSRFATLSGIYDTWQRRSEWWDDALELVRTLHFAPASYWLSMGLRDLMRRWDAKYRWVGPILVEKGRRSSERTAEGAEVVRSKRGTRVGVCNSRAINEVSEMLEASADVVIGYGFEQQNGKSMMYCSVRTPWRYDCGGLAKRWGGGGHRSAAGFAIDLATRQPGWPRDVVLALVDQFEEETR